jgi:hypothetical protein
MNPNKLGWWIRLILRIGTWKNDDPDAKRDEIEGFEYIDKSSNDPIIELARQLQKSEKTAA